ncbi:hypothetical protein VCV18_011887 [Metarhizium anisopliae]
MEPSNPDAASFTLRPIIQDLVRTRFAIPGSIFLVEDIQTIALTESRRWQVIRLLLGDGELCIQALLADAMHRFVHTRDITVGSYVCVQDFQLRQRTTAADAGEPQQQMVYLVVYDVKTLGCNDDNWSCNVLAIVASLSAVESCHLPPYRQRTARITDPSTAKQVHLAVFLDPDEFTPRVGSAVLLTGVKNHRFDGGSLKKYASDRGRGRWWFQDPWELAWCDVRGIKDWWAEMEAYFASQLSEEAVGGDV